MQEQFGVWGGIGDGTEKGLKRYEAFLGNGTQSTEKFMRI